MLYFYLGISLERKGSIISQLNSEFHSYLDKDQSIASAYETMVNRNPYKVMANFAYDWDEQPLKDTSENRPDVTDVSL